MMTDKDINLLSCLRECNGRSDAVSAVDGRQGLKAAELHA